MPMAKRRKFLKHYGGTISSYAFRYYLLIILSTLIIWSSLLAAVFFTTTKVNKSRVLEATENELQTLIDIKNNEGELKLIEHISSPRYSYSLYSYYYLYVDSNSEYLAGDIKKWPTVTSEEGNFLYFDIPLLNHFEPESKSTEALGLAFTFIEGKQILVAHSTQIFKTFTQLISSASVIALAFFIPLGFLSAFTLAYFWQRQFESFNRSIKRIMGGDLNERITINSRTVESKEMAENLNAMLDKICLLMEDVRRVSDNIAHDLNTPLARLKNDIQRLIDASPGDQQQPLRNLLVECNTILETFSSLLRVAKIESGGAKIDRQHFVLDTVVDDVMELYEPLAESQGIELITTTSSSHYVTGDRNMLFQIIANILDNSIKYSDQDSKISISLNAGARRLGTCALDAIDYDKMYDVASSRSEINEYEYQNYVSVRLTDQGPGIPRHNHKKIFQRFYREEKSRSIKPGNGLGLSMVLAVMQIHQGAIYVDSLSPGLSITLILPTRDT